MASKPRPNKSFLLRLGNLPDEVIQAAKERTSPIKRPTIETRGFINKSSYPNFTNMHSNLSRGTVNFTEVQLDLLSMTDIDNSFSNNFLYLNLKQKPLF